MTTQDIIKQTESFTIEQKQELLYFLLFSIIGEEKRNEFANLFHRKDDIKQHTNFGISNLLKYSGILEGIDTSDISEEELYLQED